MPRWLSLGLIKFLSYRGRNPLVKSLEWLANQGIFLDLFLRGRADAMPHVVRGLRSGNLAARNRAALRSDADFQDYGSKVGYESEQDDLAIALRYKAWIDSSSHFEEEEARLGTQFYFAIQNTSRIIDAHPKIKRFINFGACYGLIDYQLAKRHPHVKFYGVDRAEAIKLFNDEQFSAPNLEYVAAKITDFLTDADDLTDVAFFHMRTMMIFPESFVRDLYEQLRDKGVYAIVGIEPFGYSLAEKCLYEFSDTYKPSILYRGDNLIHNYPGWARATGLSVLEEKWFRRRDLPQNETATNRIYAYVGVREES